MISTHVETQVRAGCLPYSARPGQGLGLFSEAGDPRLGLTLPIGDSGALLGVMLSSDDMVRLCRCAEIGPSFGRPVSETCTELALVLCQHSHASYAFARLSWSLDDRHGVAHLQVTG